jgi:hypothetical protein
LVECCVRIVESLCLQWLANDSIEYLIYVFLIADMRSYLASNDALEDLIINMLKDKNPLAVITGAAIVQNAQASESPCI